MARPKRYFVMPEIDQPDPEPGFQHSSDEFVIPATDEEGHSARVQFRVPLQLYEWLSNIVASKKFPFVREGDLMRYGVYLGCVQLARIEKSVPDMQGAIDQAAAVVRRRMYGASLMRHVEHLAEDLEELRKLQAWGEMIYVLAGEHRAAEKQIQSEPYWGRRWKEELTTRFDHLRVQAQSKLDPVDLRPSVAFEISDKTED